MTEIQQGSDEWFGARHQLITGTLIDTILKSSPTTKTYYQAAVDKASYGQTKIFFDSNACRHGRLFEPVAKCIWSYKHRQRIFDTGILIHKDYPILGASPDGITENGKLIEIKCPYTRVIGQNKTSSQYESQVQMELACSKYNECSFVEAKFTRYTEEEFWDSFDTNSEIQGIIIGDKVSPIELSNSYSLKTWFNTEYCQDCDRSPVFWRLEVWTERIIKKDEEWFNKTDLINKCKEFWDLVLRLRVEQPWLKSLKRPVICLLD